MYLKKYCIFLFIWNLSWAVCWGQNKLTLSGKVTDKNTQTSLVGAYINIINKNTGTVTDIDGNFSIQLPSDTLSIQVEYLGYTTYQSTLFLKEHTLLNIALQVEKSTLKEVVVESKGIQQELDRTQMSMTSIDSKEAKLIPVFFGEIDLIKTLSLKPGVQSGNEGNSGLYVRGGGPDQNLILMDDALVFNASHLLGFFSLFNPDAVKNIELYKGDFPAQYGGRLSSVVDIFMSEGSKEKTHIKGGIGLISSRLGIEGPILRNKISYNLTARRTYVDLFTPAINKLNENKKDFDPIPSYYFYDFNGKISADVSKNDKLYLTAYYGRDILKIDNPNFDSQIRWGNMIVSAGWKHQFNDKFSVKTNLSASNYKYAIFYQSNNLINRLQTFVTDITLKSDFSYFRSPTQLIKFGFQSTAHFFNIGRIQRGNENESDKNAANILNAREFAIYGVYEKDISEKWKVNIGGRISAFNSIKKWYFGIEPRLSARYKLSNSVALKASYSRMYQYLHLVSNSGATLPNDIWYPSTDKVKPQRSDQVATGISIGLFDNKYLLSNEIYYKWMNKQIDLKDGAQIFQVPDMSTDFAVGKGWAYGNELYIEKKKGKFTGWIGYTLSWTWRQFDEINFGNKYPARYDRRHNVSVVALYKLSERITLSAAWVFATGNAITLPYGRFVFQDNGTAKANFIPEYMPRNSFRMPSSHRLDIGLVMKLKPKYGESDLTFSVYNLYNRRNPYFIYIDNEVLENGQKSETQFAAKIVSLFPIIPSITYNFKF
jgi:outer membrane cobalamin receptor